MTEVYLYTGIVIINNVKKTKPIMVLEKDDAGSTGKIVINDMIAQANVTLPVVLIKSLKMKFFIFYTVRIDFKFELFLSI